MLEPPRTNEFGVVRLYRTVTIYIVTGETRSAGCLCLTSAHAQPPSTSCVKECVRFGSCSGGFNHTEPPLPPALLRHHGMECAYALVCSVRRHRTFRPAAVQEIQCVQGGCALVRGGSSKPRTHVSKLSTPCSLCNEVVRCA